MGTHICFSYIAKFHIAYSKDKVFVDIKKSTHHIGIVNQNIQNNNKKPHSIQVHYYQPIWMAGAWLQLFFFFFCYGVEILSTKTIFNLCCCCCLFLSNFCYCYFSAKYCQIKCTSKTNLSCIDRKSTEQSTFKNKMKYQRQ